MRKDKPYPKIESNSFRLDSSCLEGLAAIIAGVFITVEIFNNFVLYKLHQITDLNHLIDLNSLLYLILAALILGTFLFFILTAIRYRDVLPQYTKLIPLFIKRNCDNIIVSIAITVIGLIVSHMWK